MQTLSDYRERYGSVYVIEVTDKFIVPFRLLSLEEYFDYNRSLNMGLVVKAVIENEIFCECVQDPVLVQDIGKHKAGTVSFVTDAILRYSAPSDVEEFNQLFNVSRAAVGDLLHQSICTICMAFPAYTPDDIYAMDIEKIMMRLALAERKLIETGVLKGPIGTEVEKRHTVRLQNKRKVDPDKLKEIYEQEGIVDNRAKQEPIAEHATDKDGNVIISGSHLVHQLNTDPTADSPTEKLMLEEAKKIYGSYLQDIQKGKKVKIKTDEERIAETEQRIQARQKKGIQKKRKG